MVKLMIGKKGSGKTKKMIDMANDSVATAKGSIVFINNDKRLTRELNYRMRVVCAEDYQYQGTADEFIGFILGILSSDHDIETIFIDSITKHANISLSNVESFVEGLDTIAEKHEVGFVVSISADAEEISGLLQNHEVLN